MTFLLLIFGFILIEMPIVAFLSVVNDVHQPLPILIMALICTVIDVFIITNRITFHKANGGNEERMRKIRKAVKNYCDNYSGVSSSGNLVCIGRGL